MSKARALKSYGALPMSFEMNQGQADRTVRFLARGQGYAILLKPDGAVRLPKTLGSPKRRESCQDHLIAC